MGGEEDESRGSFVSTFLISVFGTILAGLIGEAISQNYLHRRFIIGVITGSIVIGAGLYLLLRRYSGLAVGPLRLTWTQRETDASVAGRGSLPSAAYTLYILLDGFRWISYVLFVFFVVAASTGLHVIMPRFLLVFYDYLIDAGAYTAFIAVGMAAWASKALQSEQD